MYIHFRLKANKRYDTKARYSLTASRLVCLEKEFSDCKSTSKPSVRTYLRIILYVESKMFFEPIPDRSKDISSINTLEFLLRKQAHMIVCHTIEELWVVCLGIRNGTAKTFLLLFFIIWILLFLFTRKNYLCIVQLYSFLLFSPKYLLLYDKPHSYSLFNNHCICYQLGSTNSHNIQE